MILKGINTQDILGSYPEDGMGTLNASQVKGLYFFGENVRKRKYILYIHPR